MFTPPLKRRRGGNARFEAARGQEEVLPATCRLNQSLQGVEAQRWLGVGVRESAIANQSGPTNAHVKGICRRQGFKTAALRTPEHDPFEPVAQHQPPILVPKS